MLHIVRSKFLPLLIAGGIALSTGCVSAPPPAPPPAHHPAYLHALSDLRAARWCIEHRPGDWAQTADEQDSVRQIDAAIGDIKQAALDDGKNLADHPPVDEYPDRRGRIHEAVKFLQKARDDISREEDNGYANGLRDRAIGHIDGAIHAARRVFRD
ncbi:MAG TPA: hypothetical protein VKG05_09320 [Steroidobacteraceae bacterium]|nr:hypothetical protein [Steroidobacteraceae bacterium]